MRLKLGVVILLLTCVTLSGCASTWQKMKAFDEWMQEHLW